MNEHFLSHDAAHIHHRWNHALAPALTVRPGDGVLIQCRDSSDGQATRDTTAEQWMRRDQDRIHALTGPVFIEGAMPGDVLEVEIRSIRHFGWGWSSIIPGLGFLSERFTEPYFFVWELEEHYSRSMAPAVVPLDPFCGIMGVARAQPGEFRTRQPGVFGGNLDVRQLTRGATLYLPVQVAGALFSCGDAHAAQGDGEVCINGIEMPSEVELRFKVRRDFHLRGPFAETGVPFPKMTDLGSWIVIESDEDVLAAARRATDRVIDFLVERYHFTPENAYVLCSATMDLKLAQVVNAPVFTATASLPKNVLAGTGMKL